MKKTMVVSDLEILAQEFSAPGERVGVFGSATRTVAPRDVDVFVRTNDALRAEDRLRSLPLRSPLLAIDVDGYRERSPKPAGFGGLHIVFITSYAAEFAFLQRSQIHDRTRGWCLP